MDENTPPPIDQRPTGSGSAQPNPAPPPLLVRPQLPPAGSRRGTGWMVLSVFLLIALAISVLLNLGTLSRVVLGSQGSRYALEGGPKIQEMLVRDGPGSQRVAVIELDGIITGQAIDPAGFSMVDVIRAQLSRAAADPRVQAVILKLDTPGGEVLAADEINRAVADFQRMSDKPVIGAMGSVAASGGYYVAAACRWIVANELTLTGSIGVIMQSYNYRGLMDKIGLQPEVYKSGRFKDMLSGAREVSQVDPEERRMLQKLIDETYQRFQEVVRTGRKRAAEMNENTNQPLATDWVEYADGRVFSGKQAFELGFVDELGNFEDAVRRARQITGMGDPDIIRYQQAYDLSDLFRLFGKSETQVLQVDVGIERPKLRAGALYYVCPSYVH